MQNFRMLVTYADVMYVDGQAATLRLYVYTFHFYVFRMQSRLWYLFTSMSYKKENVQETPR